MTSSRVSTSSGNARSQLDPSLWEMPGAMPEIVPGGDFGANIDRLFTERSMVMQAWGAYGVLWPVIHQWLGVSPELGRGRVAVVPQLPDGQAKAAADKIKLGSLAIDVAASVRVRRLRPGSPGMARSICASVPFCRMGQRSLRRH